MILRNLVQPIHELALVRNKMVFLSGPRQAGKTTLAKTFVSSKSNYFNWDHLPFRKKWLLDSEALAEDLLLQNEPRIILDEFHKNRKWKNQLKGFYDQHGQEIQIILTGSARLNVFRKGADSLMGRFIHFHLLPLSLGEILNHKPVSFFDFVKYLKNPLKVETSAKAQKITERLFKYGGFPEPYESQNDQFHQIWKKNRNELLIRQDLKEVSNVLDIGQVEILASFLPDRVGSPISVQSLREDLDVAHTTVTRWLLALSQVYHHYDVRPFSKSIARSLKKEAKIYLYDWSEVESPGPKFENMVASSLLKLIHYYNDTGQADLKLYYLRDKDNHEVDFLVTQKNNPLFSVEAKLTDRLLDKNFRRFQKITKAPHFQIIYEEPYFRKFEDQAYVLSFDQFFLGLP